MDTMRSLRQPGPAHPSRIDCFRGDLVELRLDLKPGTTLNEAVTAPMVEAGFTGGTVMLTATGLDPFRYVMPGPADSASHVAYFSAPHAPSGLCRIDAGQRHVRLGGRQAVHPLPRGLDEPDGSRRGGHILPDETIVAEPGEALGWGFRTIRIETKPDPETNFTLFQPSGGIAGQGVFARIKPNEDIITALETICRAHGISHAEVRGSLGSLIGARFAGGDQVDDHATEVLVRQGTNP